MKIERKMSNSKLYNSISGVKSNWTSLCKRITPGTHLQGFDLVLEAVDVLLRDLLAGDLALDPLEPAVQIVQVLPGLAELLLHGLLKGQRKRAVTQCSWWRNEGHVCRIWKHV